MRKILLALALALFPIVSWAQTSCGGAPLPVTLNETWTVANWNGCWNYLLNNIQGGGVPGSNFNATFPTAGLAVGAYNGGNMVYLGADAFHDLNVNMATPIPAGGNLIGSVTQSGTWNVGLTGIIPLPVGAATSVLQGGVYNTTPPSLISGNQVPLQVDASGNLKVNIIQGGGTGGGGGTSSAFNASFPAAGTAAGASNGTNLVPLLVDASGYLEVDLKTALPAGSNVIGAVTQSGTWTLTSAAQGSAGGGVPGTVSGLVGGIYNSPPPTLTTGQQAALQLDGSGNLRVNVAAGLVSTFSSAFPTTGTPIGVKNGANMVYLTADASNNLDINCVVGCAGGTTSNASSGVATTSTNGASVAYNYAFNGATWDQLQDDGSKNLKVVVNAALPAGSNAIGAVTQSGTWNINNVAGTISLPTGAATAANQTSVIGTNASGTAAANSVLMGGVYNSAQPTPATSQQGAIQLDSHGNLRQAPGALTLYGLDISVVTTGGTAVTAFNAGHRTAGGWILNPIGASIYLCINEIGTASGTSSSGNTTCIAPGQTYTLAPTANAVSVIASDNSHVFSGMGWQ